jgi:hypothetical protein
MRFAKVNNIVGWIVGLVATTAYVMTMEATGSFWDCGEFISSAYKLEIPHPPGAPLFALMGRFFIILFGDSPHTAARAVNFLSALASGVSILFLFWITTHFARKIVMRESSMSAPDRQQTFLIMAAGVVGALAGAFCDSFWYSAVEGEVYASSAFFTALVFWSILKWEHSAGKPGADRWIVFIFYMMGLSIGVHLLNLLTIPAVVMVFYFRRYKPTLWGTLIAFGIGCLVTGFVLKFVIQYTIKAAGTFDIFFVNNLGMPFFAGFTTFFALLAVLFVLFYRIAVRRNFYYLRLGLWSGAFMLLGYSTYLTTLERSNADPPVDMYNVDNPVNLVGYLSRDQYGDWPILYGPDFEDPAPQADRGDLYVKGPEKYEVAGKIPGQDWGAPASAHFFPRMWYPGNERHEIDAYRRFSDLAEGDNPTMADNIRYFIRYQTGWMYLRYFMWNFSGKQNDLEGFGNPRDGNAITGIPFIDDFFLGDQSNMPDSIHTLNKSYNRMYLLPLILGLIGMVYQFLRHRTDWIVMALLFFFTGEAIVIYLNQAGFQPRERDYAFAGSFSAFSIWIGLGVLGFQQLLERYLARRPPTSPSDSPAPTRFRLSLSAYATAGLCFLCVPVLMAAQEWDDHDRSKKTLPRDLAKDYLESCPPNAILFSFGDNDTYPLWYAQEVEGIRPDVRVMVYSLLGADWYINDLRYKVNENDPFDVIFSPEQIMGDRRSVAYFTSKVPGFDPAKYYDLYSILKNVVGSDDQRYTEAADNGGFVNLIPTRKFSIPVDTLMARRMGQVHPKDSVVNELRVDIPGKQRYLLKNQLAMLAVIAGSHWRRPVCFTTPQELSVIGLDKFVRLRGMIYQLAPVAGGGEVDNDGSYRTIMEKFAYGHADRDGVYFDEENRRHLNSIKLVHAQVAMSLALAGRKDSARRILEQYDRHVLPSNMPYGMTSNVGNMHDYFSFEFLQACYAADDTSLAKKVAASLKKDLQQQMRYYQSFSDARMSDEQLAINAQMALQGKGGNLSDLQAKYFAQDILSTYQLLAQMDALEKKSLKFTP